MFTTVYTKYYHSNMQLLMWLFYTLSSCKSLKYGICWYLTLIAHIIATLQALDSHVPLVATALDSSRVEAPVRSQGTEKLDMRSEWQSKRVAFVFVYFFQVRVLILTSLLTQPFMMIHNKVVIDKFIYF